MLQYMEYTEFQNEKGKNELEETLAGSVWEPRNPERKEPWAGICLRTPPCLPSAAPTRPSTFGDDAP